MKMDSIQKCSMEVINSLELQQMTEYEDLQFVLKWY